LGPLSFSRPHPRPAFFSALASSPPAPGSSPGGAGEVGPADAGHVHELRRKLHRVAAAAGLRRGDPPIEVVEVPHEGKTLPGYFLRPDASGKKRPTIIVADNVSEELYYWGIPAIERGYNALFVDSPGIGLNPFKGIAFRADTEVPVNAAIDYLFAQRRGRFADCDLWRW
jgi:hypothetical protein